MRISVAEAADALERQGRLQRHRTSQVDQIIERISEALGITVPGDLEDFYRSRISRIADSNAIGLVWTDWVTKLLHAQAVPIFFDGCGSLYGLDLTGGNSTPAVYFFDHEDQFSKPHWAAGSSLGAFMLLLADQDRAYRENWPDRWQLSIDPDIDKCPRAPAIWNAG